MSWLSSFLHPERGYDEALKQLQNYYNQSLGFQQPYQQHGQDVYPQLSGAMNSLLDPQGLQDKWSSGYQESQAAKDAEGMATQHGLNAASSLGLMGSSPALQSIQAGTSQIVAADKQKYLDDLMEKYKTGIGLGKGIYDTGASTAGNMGQAAMNMGQNAAGMAYGKANAPGEMFGQGLSIVGKLIEQYLTGGFDGGVGSWNPGGS